MDNHYGKFIDINISYRDIFTHSDHQTHSSHSRSLTYHSRTHAHTHTNVYIMIKDLLVSFYTQFQKDHNKRMPHKF